MQSQTRWTVSLSTFNLANLDPYLSRGIAYRVSMRAVAVTGFKSDFSPTASFSF